MPPLFRRLLYCFLLGLIAQLPGSPAEAIDTLPYTTRTRPYAGWSATARGDIRTVGMAGAVTGLADTFLATGNNPAGLAMTLDGGDLSFSSNTVYDGHVQNYDDSVSSNAYGVALPVYPWGLGVGYFGPYNEGTHYLAGSPQVEIAPELSTRQFEISVGRVFFDNQLAIGMGLNFGQSSLEIADLSPGGSATAYHSYAVGANFGVMVQLPHRFLFGAGYNTPMHFSAATSGNPSPVVANFFQPVEIPARSTIALGWIPNRFFRADFDFEYIGATPSAALIRDETITTGGNAVIVPRLGGAYTFADYKELQATAFAGTYVESARQAGSLTRLHVTSGVEVKPWVLTVGWGIDRSANYYNYLFSFGVDVFKLMTKAELIPTPYHPLYQGLLPSPFHSSDVGLARPLQKNWHPRGPDMNPIDIVTQLPTKFTEKVENFADKVTGTKPEPKPSPTPKPAPKPSPKAKLKTQSKASRAKVGKKSRVPPPQTKLTKRVKKKPTPKTDDAD